MPLQHLLRALAACLLLATMSASAQTPGSAFNWSPDPNQNGSIDPAIPAGNSAAARDYTRALRGVMSGVAQALGTAGQPNGLARIGPDGRLATPGLSLTGSVSSGDASGLSAQNKAGTLQSLKGVLGGLPLTPQAVGATCNGTADDTSMLTGLLGFQSEITIASGTCRITASVVWPKGKTIRFAPGAGLTVDAGQTLTIRSRIEAPLQRIFYGAGAVVGLKENRPEWWGALNTYGYAPGRDDAPAFNAAMASARASVAPDGTPSDGDRPSIRFSGYYYACSSIDLFPSPVINLGLYGSSTLNGGGTITTCPAFNGTALLNVHGISKANGAFTGFDVDFRDFQLVNAAGSGAQIGMSWVPEGAGFSLTGGLHPASVANMAVSGFPTNIKYQNTRLVKFDRVSSWSSNKATSRGLWITSSDNQSFTGDTEFINFNTGLCGSSFDNTLCAGVTNIRIDADGAVGAGPQNSERVKGIRFLLSLANAEKAIDVSARNGAYIGDMWVLPGTQIDGFACNTITLAAGNDSGNTSGAVIDNFNLIGTYNRGRNVGCTAFTAFATEYGATRSIFVTGNWFANTYKVANFFNTKGVHFDGNTVYDPMAVVQDSAVSISSTTDFTANGNILTRSGANTFTSLVSIGAGSDFGFAVNNLCNSTTTGCVANTTGSSNVIATPNIAH